MKLWNGFKKRAWLLCNLDMRAFAKAASFEKDGYFGYQKPGLEETTVVLKNGSDFASFAFYFATELLTIQKDEAIRQIQLSLREKQGEIYLANRIGEKYLFRQGDGHTVKYRMLNDSGKPVMLDAPGKRMVR